MILKCKLLDIKILQKAAQQISFPKDKDIPIDSKFRYSMDYNDAKFDTALAPARKLLILEPDDYKKYQEYLTRSTSIENDLKLEMTKDTPDADKVKELQSIKEGLADEYKDIIELVTEKSKKYEKALEEEVEVSIHKIPLSRIPLLSSNPLNDHFMKIFQKFGIIEDDVIAKEQNPCEGCSVSEKDCPGLQNCDKNLVS